MMSSIISIYTLIQLDLLKQTYQMDWARRKNGGNTANRANILLAGYVQQIQRKGKNEAWEVVVGLLKLKGYNK